MKNRVVYRSVLLILFLEEICILRAGAREPAEPVTTGIDFVSNYIWRGSKFGSGPAVQPFVEYAAGGLSVGAWGSCCISEDEAAEADLYLSYQRGPVTIGTTAYYFPENSFFKARNHAFELNSRFESGIFSLSANCVLNEGAGSQGGDLYFEAGLKTGSVNLFAGAGNGWLTRHSKFNLCNLGVSASREIRVTDAFSLPVTVSAILNPDSGIFYVAAGIHL
jgi:hypothetical protein